MATIGIVDDREQDRRLIAEIISLGTAEDGWDIVDNAPLPSLLDYPTWITENEISVLVIDEIFDALINGKAVKYQGHDIISFVRERMPSLPIFVITAYQNEDLLRARYKHVEEIIPRIDFSKKPEDFIPRIIRSAQNFLSVYEAELNELSDFAQKAALGTDIDSAELSRVEAIRQHLGIAFPIESISNINDWIKEASDLADKLEKLRIKLQARANRNS